LVEYLNETFFDSVSHPIGISFGKQLLNILENRHRSRQSWNEIIQNEVIRSENLILIKSRLNYSRFQCIFAFQHFSRKWGTSMRCISLNGRDQLMTLLVNSNELEIGKLTSIKSSCKNASHSSLPIFTYLRKPNTYLSQTKWLVNEIYFGQFNKIILKS
jgi:hypothetical protein